jgi:phage baseplate assembly protein W
MKRCKRPVLYDFSSGSSLVMWSVMRYEPRVREGRVRVFWVLEGTGVLVSLSWGGEGGRVRGRIEEIGKTRG